MLLLLSRKFIDFIQTIPFRIAIVHFFLAQLLFLERIVFYQPDFSLPFTSLFITIAATAIFAFTLGFISVFLKGFLSRLSFALFFTAINLYFVFNLMFYKLYFRNFDFTSVESSTSLLDTLASSLLFEIDTLLLVNIVIALLCTKVMWRWTQSAQPFVIAPKRAFIFSALLLLALFVTAKMDIDHPFFHLIHQAAKQNSPAAIANTTDSFSTDITSFARSTPDETDTFSTVNELLAEQKNKPNVVLVVLESVGSLQLLSNTGAPSKSLTPVLSELASRSIVFDSIYSVFPGTTRAHVALNTGGHTITASGVFSELSYPYNGPTLARTFQANGYRTAMFSSSKLSFENMSGWYKYLGYDTIFDFETAGSDFQQRHSLHSWGGDEQAVLALATNWLEQPKTSAQPFFLTYLTNATHHPYSIPKNYKAPFSGNDRQSRYLNALHYTDNALKEIIDYLKKNNLLDNTIIAITGDHGEAFGDIHAKNLLHANYIYEENVKSFLILSHPALTSHPFIAKRIGSLGDIMPTLLAAAKIPAAETPGQNLLSPAYKKRIQFFYKNAAPALWGLRDGNWKFIGEQLDEQAELYNLKEDSHEQHNVAHKHPQQVAMYKQILANWYVAADKNFTDKLAGYESLRQRAFTATEVLTPGPKVITFGFLDAAFNFQQSDRFHPNENIHMWTRWVPYQTEKTITYRWLSPSGEKFEFPQHIPAGLSVTQLSEFTPIPMQEGTWTAQIIESGTVIAENSFQVFRSEILHNPLTAPAIKEIDTGLNEGQDYAAAEVTEKNERVVVRTRWWPPLQQQKLTYVWYDPKGKPYRYTYTPAAGWRETWVSFDGEVPMKPGLWRVYIENDNKQKLGGTSFLVTDLRKLLIHDKDL